MKYAPSGKWFVRIINTETKESVVWPYDGFKTKKEAQMYVDKWNDLPLHKSGKMVAILEK